MSVPKEIHDLHATDELGPTFIGLQLYQLLAIIDHQGREMFAELGVEGPSRSGSTMIYMNRKGPVSVTDLARFLGVSHQLAGHRIKDLKAYGLITETGDPDDRRRTLVGLSKAGKAVARQVERVCQKTEVEFLALFDEIGVDLYGALIKAKSALAERSLWRRIAERQQKVS